jgi:hypothetical protein
LTRDGRAAEGKAFGMPGFFVFIRQKLTDLTAEDAEETHNKNE